MRLHTGFFLLATLALAGCPSDPVPPTDDAAEGADLAGAAPDLAGGAPDLATVGVDLATAPDLSMCASGTADCDHDAANGCETQTASDNSNCGACGNMCGTRPSATLSCLSGVCAITACSPGYSDCDNDPSDGCEVNKQTDANNCGACGSVCSYPNADATCRFGACAIGACKPGFANCDGIFSNGCETPVGSDVNNCGACRKLCAGANSTQACISGACTVASCTTGYADCDGNAANGCEAKIGADTNNCGGCGNVCPVPANATATCSNGTCGVGGCKFGFADCDSNPSDGCEANLLSTTTCGACNIACSAPANASAGCNAGMCGIGLCNSLWGDCDKSAANGCERSLATDLANCGGCGKVCSVANGTPVCLGGQCGISSCNSGYNDCDNSAANGCESYTANDPKNCGACGKACQPAPNATATCGGQCGWVACQTGYADCDNNTANGCEVNVNSNAQNCGACGNVCPSTAPVCVSGTCSSKLRVLLVHGGETASKLGEIASNLLGTGSFSVVDTFDAYTGSQTPSLSKLQGYDVVLVWAWYSFYDPATLGNNLADYYDGGGQVVLAVFAVSAGNLTGRFGTASSGYLLINPVSYNYFASSLGTVAEPASPLMNGVKTLSASYAYASPGTPINGGIVVASWSDGRPLIVRGVVKGRNRVDINLYPISNVQYSGGWVGDGTNLIRNALLYR